MLLSDNGDHPMTKLSDSQTVILSAAAQRDDGAVLPLPETLKIKGGAVSKVLGSLKAKGLIEHQGTPRGDDPPPLRITRAGLQAIGVETEDDAPEGANRATGRTSADRSPTRSTPPAPATGAAAPATPATERHAGQGQGRGERDQGCAGREAHAPRRHQAGADDRPAQARRGRHGRADRRGHRVAAPYHPRRHLGRAEEEARPHRRDHPHPRGRP